MVYVTASYPDSLSFPIPPGIRVNEDEGITWDVPRIRLWAGDGGAGEDSQSGGSGAWADVYLNVNEGDEIDVILGENGEDAVDNVSGVGGAGYVDGQDGEATSGSSDGGAGGGGGSSAILVNGQVAVHVGGGGGGGGDASTLVTGPDGGDGGGPGGAGGNGGATLGASGSDGERGEVTVDETYVQSYTSGTELGDGGAAVEYWADAPMDVPLYPSPELDMQATAKTLSDIPLYPGFELDMVTNSQIDTATLDLVPDTDLTAQAESIGDPDMPLEPSTESTYAIVETFTDPDVPLEPSFEMDLLTTAEHVTLQLPADVRPARGVFAVTNKATLNIDTK